jgi:hypothetical protein
MKALFSCSTAACFCEGLQHSEQNV